MIYKPDNNNKKLRAITHPAWVKSPEVLNDKHPQSNSIPLMRLIVSIIIKRVSIPFIIAAAGFGKIPKNRHMPVTSSMNGRTIAIILIK